MPLERLVQSILDPNREISPQHTTWDFVTRQGPRTGIIIRALGSNRFLLGQADGTTVEIDEKDVLLKEQRTASLMPEELVDRLSLDEFRDLLAYLRNPEFRK